VLVAISSGRYNRPFMSFPGTAFVLESVVILLVMAFDMEYSNDTEDWCSG